MENNYLNRLETLDGYFMYLEQLEEEKKQIIAKINQQKQECSHEILITFGHVNSVRCFGLAEEYHCPICGKKILLFQNDSLDNKNIIDFRNSQEKVEHLNILPVIRQRLKEYLQINPEASLQDIYNFINAIDINDLVPKQKNITRKI